MTSLIDVIFLLLLFFMLTSTFSHTAELDLDPTGSGGGMNPADTPPLFVQLRPEGLRLNGQPLAYTDAPRVITAHRKGTTQPLILSVANGVQAQGLADALTTLRAVPGTALRVIW